MASLKARLQNAAGTGFDVPAKEQVASLKSRIADLEEKNKQLNDKNYALEKEQKDGVVNGENGVEEVSSGDGAEVIAELKKRIKELEGVVEMLKVEKEAAESAGEKVKEESTEGAKDEKDKLKETVKELQAKIEVMQKEHEREVEKLKQELVNVGLECIHLLLRLANFLRL